MKPRAVYDTFCAPHSEFDGFLYSKFASRLRYMRHQLNDQDDRAATEMADLNHDRLLFPAPAVNHRGEPRWDGSDAQRYLAIDIAEGRHTTMQPQELHATRPGVYDEHALPQFRSHIYQQVKKNKFVLQYYVGERDTYHH